MPGAGVDARHWRCKALLDGVAEVEVLCSACLRLGYYENIGINVGRP